VEILKLLFQFTVNQLNYHQLQLNITRNYCTTTTLTPLNQQQQHQSKATFNPNY